MNEQSKSTDLHAFAVGLAGAIGRGWQVVPGTSVLVNGEQRLQVGALPNDRVRIAAVYPQFDGMVRPGRVEDTTTGLDRAPAYVARLVHKAILRTYPENLHAWRHFRHLILAVNALDTGDPDRRVILAAKESFFEVRVTGLRGEDLDSLLVALQGWVGTAFNRSAAR